MICISDNKIQLISNVINKKNCTLVGCDNNFPEHKNSYKINTENGCLTQNCSIINYKYEFENKCFEECPANSMERNNSKELEEFGLDYKYFCKPKCTEENPFEIINTQKCVKNCNLTMIKNKMCILNYESKNNVDSLLKNIEDIFTSNDYNTLEIENGIDDIIKYNDVIVTLTTTANQKNNENNSNVTTINLGNCENILKNVYNISKNETLFMRKIDVKEEGMMIPKIEFDVYYKLNGTNLVEMNLSYCSNTKIDIRIPIKITDNIDKYNSSSGYYNDICYTTTSDDGTDITLKDRKDEFINNNRTVCQENCFFSEYDYNINKAKCSCDIKEYSSTFENIKIDKQKLYENFIDIKNIANINILMCYKALFSKKGIIKNYGSYSVILIIIIHLIIIIIFYAKNLYKKILNLIANISFGIKNFQYLKTNEPNDNIKNIKD